MDLQQACNLIAAQVHTDAAQLYQYAMSDTLGGYHIDESQRRWPMGSLWGVEGQILYALVRALKPQRVVQIGGWGGCSAMHLALACKDNGSGQVVSVDNGSEGAAHGSLITDDLKPFIELVNADGATWLAAQPDASVDLLFEDASHATELVRAIAGLALTKVQPGGVMVNHDAAHDFAYVGGGQRVPSPVGWQIREGLAQAHVYFRPYLIEPSDCGLSVTVIPGERKITPEYIGNANIESVSPPPIEPTIDTDAAVARLVNDPEVQQAITRETPKRAPKQRAKRP